MSEPQSGYRTRVAALLAAVFVALHGLGVFAYITRNVLKYPWLWDNADYMLFLNAAYYHLHAVVLAGHLYLWGPYLIARRYRRRWWSLYYVSLAGAYIFQPARGSVQLKLNRHVGVQVAVFGGNFLQ